MEEIFKKKDWMLERMGGLLKCGEAIGDLESDIRNELTSCEVFDVKEDKEKLELLRVAYERVSNMFEEYKLSYMDLNHIIHLIGKGK